MAKLTNEDKSQLKIGKDYIGVGAGALIVNDKGEILMMKRADYKDKTRALTTSGMWSIPGGQVEFGETAEAAILREIKEEIGVDAEIVKFIGYTDQILRESGVHWLVFHFLCKIKDGAPHVMEPDKIEKLEWISVSDVPQNAGIAHVIRPLYLLGWITEEEYQKRVKSTAES